MSFRLWQSSTSNLLVRLIRYVHHHFDPPFSWSILIPHYPIFQENCERILAYQLTSENPQFFFSPDIALAVQEVWADEIIPALMENSSKFYLMDSAS
jgi:hypothetical protein